MRLLWLKVYAAPAEEPAPDSSHGWAAPDEDSAGELAAGSRESDASRVVDRPRASWAAASAPRRVAPWLRAATPVVEPVPEPTIPDLLAPTRLEAF